MGCKIFDPATRQEITPEQARERALDKRAYDQNYECSFADENLTLLTYELITAAELEGVGDICEQQWSSVALARLRGCNSPLYAGFDVARRGDLSVIMVIEKIENIFFARAILRMRDLRLPEQQERLGTLCALPQFQRVAIDMTGLGLGLVEFAQAKFGGRKIQGVNFARSVPVTNPLLDEGRGRDSVRVTEAMALEVLRAYEERRVRQPVDARLRDDLRKPERVTSPGGRVSIAATRDEAGHADHFWSLALALEAAATARPNRATIQMAPVFRDVWDRRKLLI
jgi:phage FluMu gp28-like protein